MSRIPEFKSEQEESDFWDTHDVTDFLDELTLEDVTFIDARPPKVVLSVSLDPATAEKVNALAARFGVSCQALLRLWVLKGLAEESKSKTTTAESPAQTGALQKPA